MRPTWPVVNLIGWTLTGASVTSMVWAAPGPARYVFVPRAPWQSVVSAGGAAVAEGQVLGVRILEQAVFQRVGQQARQIAAGATGQRHFEPQALGAGEDDFAFGGGGPVAGLGMAFGDGLAVVAEQHPRAVGPGGPLFVDGEEEAGAHSGFTAVFARRWWASSGCGRAALPCAPWRRRSGRGRWPGSGGW